MLLYILLPNREKRTTTNFASILHKKKKEKRKRQKAQYDKITRDSVLNT